MQDVWTVDYDINPDQDDGMCEYLSLCELGDALSNKDFNDNMDGYGPADTCWFESVIWECVQQFPYPLGMSKEDQLLVTRDVITVIYRMYLMETDDIVKLVPLTVQYIEFYRALVQAIRFNLRFDIDTIDST